MSPIWTQVVSIAGSLVTTWLAAWLRNYFERRRPAIKRDAAADDD